MSYPTEASARAAIEAFLDKQTPGYPDYSICKDGADAWAFWIAEQDITSYLHADMTIEWYGTGWQTEQETSHESALLDDHLNYMARYTGHRLPLVTPCCEFRLDVPAPRDEADRWDSLMRCPNCGRLFMKVATSIEARGRLPEHEEA